jgi:hypothetical protein
MTKGAGSKKAALAVAYKLLGAAQEPWRRFNGHVAGATLTTAVKDQRKQTRAGREGCRPDAFIFSIHDIDRGS